MEKKPFVLMFPCYVLGSDCVVDPITGNATLGEHSHIITPTVEETGEFTVALFTDSHSAEHYRDAIDQSLSLVAFPTPESLAEFLRKALSRYRLVSADPNPKVQRFVAMPIAEILESLDNPGDQSL